MVCVFNQSSSKHFLETSDLEPVSGVSAPHLFPPNYFESADALSDSHHIKDKQKTEFSQKSANPETKFYDFSPVFAKLGMQFYNHEDSQILKEIFMP